MDMGLNLLRVLTLLAVLAGSSPSWAEMITYTDDDGQLHFTDSVHSVPARYRDRVELKEDAAPAGTHEVVENQTSTRLGMVRDIVYAALESTLNQALNRNKLAPLTAAEKRSLKGLIAEHTLPLVAAPLLAVLAILICTLHALIGQRFLWAAVTAIGGLLLGVLPLFPYTVLHLGNERTPLKLAALALLIAPFLLLYEPVMSLWQLTTEIVTSPLRN